MTSGSIKRDTGRASFCSWTARHITRDGQAIDINDPQMTLTSKRGTVVVRNRIGFVDIPDGWAIFTARGRSFVAPVTTPGISGGAGITLAPGSTKARFEGFLSPR